MTISLKYPIVKCQETLELFCLSLHLFKHKICTKNVVIKAESKCVNEKQNNSEYRGKL